MPTVSGPTPAETARSLVAAASSLVLDPGSGPGVVMVGTHRPDARGRLLLAVPEGSAIVARARAQVPVPVQALLVDVAPVAVRERERARLEVSAWMRALPREDGPAAWALAHPAGGRLEPGEAVLRLDPCVLVLARSGHRAVEVEVGEYADAECDPLALCEADLLQHLAGVHRHALDVFAAMAPAHLVRAADRVVPLSVDRHRLVLRLERGDGHDDVALMLPGDPCSATVEDVLLRVRALLCCGLAGCRSRGGG